MAKSAADSSKPENAALAENARDSVYSAALREELAARRTAMLRAAVGEDFSAAFDLTAYAMATKR